MQIDANWQTGLEREGQTCSVFTWWYNSNLCLVGLCYLLGQLLLSQYTWQWINRIIGRKHVISDTIGGAVFITTSGDTAISAWPLHHYQQQQLIEHESRLFIGPEMRVASWVVHRVVCLFLLGQRVYKLHYSKVKDKRREKRTHIHTRAQIMGYSLNALPFCQLHQIVLVLLRCRFPNLCEYSWEQVQSVFS